MFASLQRLDGTPLLPLSASFYSQVARLRCRKADFPIPDPANVLERRFRPVSSPSLR
jgi:hypothetical protein